MSKITPYKFEGANVRTVEIDGEPWFVAKDVTDALGYANGSAAVTTHCKGVAKRYPLQTAGGKQDARIISEPDVLRLIVNSQDVTAQSVKTADSISYTPPQPLAAGFWRSTVG